MRPEELDQALEALVTSAGPERTEASLAEMLPRQAPNAELVIVPRGFSENEHLVLALLSHYLPELLKVTVRVELEDSAWPNKRLIAKAILSNKAFGCAYFARRLSERDYYGNFKRLVERLLRNLKPRYRKPPKARRLIRRRGYRDGTSHRASSSTIHESDWELDTLQNQIEDLESFAAAAEAWNRYALVSQYEDYCRNCARSGQVPIEVLTT